MVLRVFDLHGTEKLTEWKKFRDGLEISETPFHDLANLWAQAPFVNRYLQPNDPSSWPDPWKLIIDGKFDDLAIVLGMLYTLKLTDRFKDCLCEIYGIIKNNEQRYVLMIDNNSILNFEYRSVRRRNDLKDVNFMPIWSKSDRL